MGLMVCGQSALIVPDDDVPEDPLPGLCVTTSDTQSGRIPNTVVDDDDDDQKSA